MGRPTICTPTGYEVYAGRPFLEKDYTEFHKVLLMDEAAAASLFSGKAALWDLP